MLKFLFYGLMIFVAPFLILLLVGVANWLYVLPLLLIVVAGVINGRQPSHTR